MIVKEINGKIFTMDESEFMKYAYLLRNNVFRITVLRVSLYTDVSELFEFDLESENPTFTEISNYILSIGITPIKQEGKIVYLIKHDYNTEFIFPDRMTGKEQFLTFKYLKSQGY